MEAPEACGPYRPEQLLAAGAHAAVWFGAGPDGEGVVLKIPRGAAGVDALIREASVLSLGTHPHLPRLVASDPDGQWLASEPIVGDALDTWARDRTPAEVARVGVQLADALAWLHDHGVIHGDVKPANVLVDDEGHATLLDLGIAVRVGETRERFRGTLGYAAPEVLGGATPTPASDLWSLGAALYTAIAGCSPFQAPDPAALTWLPGVTLPLPVSTWREGVPETVENLLCDLLARRPEARPASASAARDALEVTTSRPVPSPTLGNQAERDALARAVVEAAEGGSPTVVLYGPVGSGRHHLALEASRHAAREGLVAPEAGAPWFQVVDAGSGPVPDRPAGPGLWLLLSDRPWPELPGVRHVSPVPLSEDDVARLLREAEVDVSNAAAWWREALGQAGAITARVRAEIRAHGGGPFVPDELPDSLRVVFEVVSGRDRVGVSDLAEALGIGEHEVVDRLDLLIALAALAEAEDGSVHVVV
jgi:hypothetical protein